jgi:hypothetical protein
MAAETITSKPLQTPVGSSGVKLETYTQTTFTRDANGKIDSKSAKTEIFLNNSTIPGVKNWVPAAASTDGGKTWDTTSARYQKLDGGPNFGADAVRSLNEGALRTNTFQQIGSAATKAEIPKEQQKSLSEGIKNDATQQEGGDPNNAALKEDLSTPRKETRLSFPSELRYPRNLKLEHQDVIVFNMLKYEPRKANEGGQGNLGTFGERSKFTTRTIGKVTLPIPAGISDTNSVDWGQQTITSAQKALADLATAGITGGGAEAANTAGNQLNEVANSSGEIGQGLAAYFTKEAIGVSGILSRTQGAVQNPNMELLFQGPQLRPFTFTFKMSARNPDEAKDIRTIIRFFKQGMSPQKSQSNLFLKAPNTFKIQYKHRNNEHSFINKIKECALQSFTINYTPEGQYATFYDGAMVSYEMTMQFTELEPIFNEDYTGLDQNADTEIGY